MILILCADNSMGLCFNGRRQSRDRALCARLLGHCAGAPLYLSPYSAGLFAPAPGLCADPAFAEKAGPGEYAFFETDDPAPWLDKAEKIILYRWNRDYPADLHLKLPREWKLSSSFDFAGSSHPTITEEIYIR